MQALTPVMLLEGVESKIYASALSASVAALVGSLCLYEARTSAGLFGWLVQRGCGERPLGLLLSSCVSFIRRPSLPAEGCTSVLRFLQAVTLSDAGSKAMVDAVGVPGTDLLRVKLLQLRQECPNRLQDAELMVLRQIQLLHKVCVSCGVVSEAQLYATAPMPTSHVSEVPGVEWTQRILLAHGRRVHLMRLAEENKERNEGQDDAKKLALVAAKGLVAMGLGMLSRFVQGE